MEKKTVVEETGSVQAAAETAPKAKKPASRAAASKSTAKAPAKKPAAAKSRTVKKTATEKVYLQFGGFELDMAQLADRAKKAYAQEKGGEGEVQDVRVYVKPEEGKAYYVVNDTFAGELELF